jgi:GNAT superfamily N-acetyltransferase
MRDILADLSDTGLVKTLIRANWENYHYCLGRSPSVELSVGKYLTWLVTNMPDHFMNLVICTELPAEGIDGLVGNALDHFRTLNIRKLSWLTEEGLPTAEIKRCLERRGLRFSESFATEMAADLTRLGDAAAGPGDLKMVEVDGPDLLRQWIHTASIGFRVPPEFEETWYEFFAETACAAPFRTFLGLLDGRPVATSQLFTSAAVAGIYNVTCLPEARGQGIGTAAVLAPLLAARELGYRVGILQASSMGYNVYRRLGFEDFGKLGLYLWEHHPGDGEDSP